MCECGVCVYLCVREREEEKDKERAHVLSAAALLRCADGIAYVCVCVREKVCVSMCVCVRERASEQERECVCDRESVFVCMHLCAYI